MCQVARSSPCWNCTYAAAVQLPAKGGGSIEIHDYSTTAETFHESIVRKSGVFNQSKVPDELLSCISGVWFIVTTNPSSWAFAGSGLSPPWQGKATAPRRLSVCGGEGKVGTYNTPVIKKHALSDTLGLISVGT